MKDQLQVKMVPLDHLHRDPYNPRTEAGDVSELAKSIDEIGLLQSLLVRTAPDKGKDHYYITIGFRRWTAMRLGTKLEVASCRIWIPSPEMDPEQYALEAGLIENVHRETLNPIERARGYARLRDEFGMTQLQIGKSQGLSDATISHYLALMELSHKSQERVIRGSLTVERAVRAVRESRRQNRKRRGQRPVEVVWESEWFIASHPLAKQAATICDARQHTARRRYGKKHQYRGACGECWETAIRQDQDLVSGLKGDIGADAAKNVLAGMVEGGNHRT